MKDTVNSQGVSQLLMVALDTKVAKLLVENESLQARIDELMWEYCPESITREQLDNWEKHQKLAPEV